MGGVDISVLEAMGVFAIGVDVFFPVGVSLSPQGERLVPMTTDKFSNTTYTKNRYM